ncbi:hypothetical protein D6D23_08907 [Aureobasidium pullulans]|nr:hypothetical protein D6D23_08907 [Aureobasidium pullulans]
MEAKASLAEQSFFDASVSSVSPHLTIALHLNLVLCTRPLPNIIMGTPAWAIPVGVLAGLCVICLAFVWWFIPRLYTRGMQADMNRFAAEKAERERRAASLQDANGGTGDVEAGLAVPAKPVFKYTPPAYTAY